MSFFLSKKESNRNISKDLAIITVVNSFIKRISANEYVKVNPNKCEHINTQKSVVDH